MKFKNHSITFSKNSNTAHESDVIAGLSYTPSEMVKLSNNGNALSLDALTSQASYDDNYSFNMPFELIRGVDVNDAWEEQRNSSAKIERFKDGVQGKLSNTK